MAKVGVQIVGDSTSLLRALGESSTAVDKFGESYTGTFADMSKATLQLAVAQDKLAISTAKFGQGSTGAAAAALSYRNQIDAMSASQLRAAQAVGRSLTTFVTAPVALVGYEAVKMGTNFQAAMLQIQTQAGASAGEVQTLSKEVLAFASSGAQQGPVALAQALFHIESVGLRGAAAMNVLKQASAGAAVGMADLEDVATALSGAVVAGIRGTQDYGQALGTLNAIVGAGNMHMSDLLDALGTGLLPKAKNAGLSLTEVGAALATLVDRGLPAQKAATQLGTTFALMEAPSKAATAAMADMGINASSLSDMLRQPNGLLDVLELFKQRMDAVGSSRGSTDILGAFGRSRQSGAILTLIQSLDAPVSSYGDKVKQITDTTGKLAADEAAQQQTSQAKFHQALASMEADMTKLGGAITPTVTVIAQGVAKVAGAFSDLPTAIKQPLGVLVGLAAVAGPILLIGVAAKKALGAIGLLTDSIGSLPVVAGPATATVDTELASVGTAATGASTEVGLLSTRLAALSGLTIGVTIAVEEIIHRKQIGSVLGSAAKVAAGLESKIPGIGGSLARPDLNAALKGGALSWQDIAKGAASGNKQEEGWWKTIVKDNPAAQLAADKAGIFGPTAYKQQLAANKAFGQIEDRSKAALAPKPIASRDSGAFTPTAANTPPLTKAQQLELNLAAHPDSEKYLTEQAAADQSAINWLTKRRNLGKITGAEYVKQVKAFYTDKQSALTQVASLGTKAANAAKAAAKLATSIPMSLQVEQALASTTSDPGDDMKAAADIKAWAENLIASKHLTGQALVDALSTVAQANQTLDQFSVPIAMQLAQAKASTTQSTADDVKAAEGIKAWAEAQIATGKLGPQAMIAAFGVVAQANQTLGQFVLPWKDQLAQARAALTTTTADDIQVAKDIKDYAEQELKSKKLSHQGTLDALAAIANANQTLSAAPTHSVKLVTSSSFVKGLHFSSRADKIKAEQRFAQSQAHGGHRPTGVGVLGQTVVINVNGAGDPHTVAKKVATELDKRSRRRVIQTRGHTAGARPH